MSEALAQIPVLAVFLDGYRPPRCAEHSEYGNVTEAELRGSDELLIGVDRDLAFGELEELAAVLQRPLESSHLRSSPEYDPEHLPEELQSAGGNLLRFLLFRSHKTRERFPSFRIVYNYFKRTYRHKQTHLSRLRQLREKDYDAVQTTYDTYHCQYVPIARPLPTSSRMCPGDVLCVQHVE